MNKQKTIVVGLIGAPNVGKSSLLNRLINQKVSIISNKPHTTRQKVIGIRNEKDVQIIFVDTPGISNSNKKIASELGSIGSQVAKDVDLVVFIFDTHVPSQIISINTNIKKVAVINKIDKSNHKLLLPFTADLAKYFQTVFYTSALNGEGIDVMLKYIMDQAPEKDWVFPEGIVTNQSIEERLSELTREVIFQKTREEVPYQVKIQSTIKNDEIHQVITCPEAHKHIFLGMIKKISVEARQNAIRLLKKPTKLFTRFKFQ